MYHHGRTRLLPIAAGTRIGRLVTTGDLVFDRRWRWVCRCDCGVTVNVLGGALRSGTVSCGCRQAETRAFGPKAITTHGATTGYKQTSEYSSWHQMIGRCTRKSHANFDRYGGRGISVCDRWLVFQNFLEDMGPRPSPTHSIDRKENNGNYQPDNCRWATLREQNNNQRRNRRLTWNGETLTIAEWSRRMGCPYDRLRTRLRLGWSAEKALSTCVGEA